MLKQQKDHQVVPMVFFGWPGRFYIMFATQLLSPFFSVFYFVIGTHIVTMDYSGRESEILEHVDHNRVWC